MSTPSDPLDGLVMPFSVPLTVILDGYQMGSRPEHRNGYGAGNIGLPVGVSLVRVVWEGQDGIRMRLETPSGPRPYTTVVEPSSHIVPRSSSLMEIPVQEDGVFLRFQTVSPGLVESVELGLVAGVTVIPTSPPA